MSEDAVKAFARRLNLLWECRFTSEWIRGDGPLLRDILDDIDPPQAPRESDIMDKKAVVVLSGGQDSTTCLYWAKQAGYECHAITFDYNQRHKVEINAAVKIGKVAGVATHKIVTLGHILEGTSPLVSDAPLEQYKDHQSLPGGLERTFVPMRNQLFLTVAANRAYVLGTEYVVAGLCQEDYGGYPDCRRNFVNAFEMVSSLGTFREGLGRGLVVATPLMFMTKADSVRMALQLEGAYEALAFSHTAYDGAYPPNGHDHATLLRAKGFEEANVPDPLVLRAYLETVLEELPETDNYRRLRPWIDRVEAAVVAHGSL